MVGEEKNLKERVESITTRNFSITKCPEIVWKEFTDFCKLETSDSYAMGVKLLLDAHKTNAKDLMLYQKIIELEDRVTLLEGKPKCAVTKTFGAKKQEDDKNVRTK